MPACSPARRFLKVAALASALVLALAWAETASAQTGLVVDGTVGAATCAGCERSTGWRLSVAYPVLLGVGELTVGPVVGYADVGTVAEGPAVQRHHRHTRGPFAGVQFAQPITDGWWAQARVGFGYWGTALVTTVDGFDAFQASERHVGPMLGASVSLALTPALALVASVDVGQHRFDGLPTVRPVLWSLGLAAAF